MKIDYFYNLLNNVNLWDSLVINRRKPYTERLFTILPNGSRLCLHKFYKCEANEAFPHPHPWPAEFMLLKGAYKQKIWFANDLINPPNLNSEPAISMIMRKGYYSINNRLTWHSIQPLETTYTIMLNGQPWENPHTSAPTTKGKDLDKLDKYRIEEYLELFKDLLDNYYET